MIVKIVVHLSVAMFDLHEDDLPTNHCLGGSALTPRRVPGATGQKVGYKKLIVPTFKFVTPPLFVLTISSSSSFFLASTTKSA